MSNLWCSPIFIDVEEMRQELYKCYDKNIFWYRRNISFWLRLNIELASLNNSLELRLLKRKWTDFIYDNHWLELYSLLILFSAIAGTAFIIENLFLHLDAKQLNRVTSVMWLYSHAQWQMSINNLIKSLHPYDVLYLYQAIIEGYSME